MRTRSRVTGQGRSHLTVTRSNKYGVVQTQSVEDMAYLGMYKTIIDEEHPDFAFSQAMGLPVIGALNVGESETTVTSSTFEFPEGDSRWKLEGDLVTPFGRSGGELVLQRNSALNACKAISAISALKKLNTAEIDTGEILGTLGSTIAMLRRPFAGFHKLLGKMERQRIRKYGKKKKRRVVVVDESNRGDWYQATSEVWLEYSFGMRPIFGDISNVIKMYEDQVELFQQALRVAKGFHVRTVTGSDENTYVHGGENFSAGMVAVTERSAREKLACASGVYYKIPMNYSSVARGLGLGVHNLASSAWNLAPYSWIVDQVVNVGDWISACTPDPDLLVLGKYQTVKSVTDVDTYVNLRVKRALGTGEPTWYSGTGHRHNKTTSIERVPYLDLPSTPQWNPRIGNLGLALSDAAFGLLTIRRVLERFRH